MDAGVVAASFVIMIIICITVSFCLRRKGVRQRHNANNPVFTAPAMNQSDVNKLIAFLEEADNAYIRAYQYRSLGQLIQFITRELAIEMQQKITYYNDKIWGTPAHRHRTWSVVSTDGAVITVRKELTFKKVKYGKMRVKLGDDSVEYWKIIYDSMDRRYKVQEIIC